MRFNVCTASHVEWITAADYPHKDQNSDASFPSTCYKLKFSFFTILKGWTYYRVPCYYTAEISSFFWTMHLLSFFILSYEHLWQISMKRFLLHRLFFCFVERASRYMRVMKPTLYTIYLKFVHSFTIPLYVSGLLLAHHQEAAMYMYYSWYVLCKLSHMYMSPPDDGLLASSKRYSDWINLR
jgi:hypothetical protein